MTFKRRIKKIEQSMQQSMQTKYFVQWPDDCNRPGASGENAATPENIARAESAGFNVRIIRVVYKELDAGTAHEGG